MKSKICGWVLNLLGWEVLGFIPTDIKKCVMVAMPHTSNWDFPVGLLVRCKYNLKVYYVAKSSLFKPPFGWLFYALGGYPVDRSKNNNFVASVTKLFNENEVFSVVMAPEGSRSKVSRIKTGFYHLAVSAQVPIVLIAFDFEHKQIRFDEAFYPDENYENTYDRMKVFFKDVKGKNAELGYDF